MRSSHQRINVRVQAADPVGVEFLSGDSMRVARISKARFFVMFEPDEAARGRRALGNVRAGG